MVATFNYSAFNRPIVIYESPEEVTSIRLLFVFVTLIVGIFTVFQILKIYINLWQRKSSNLPFLVNAVFGIFLLNVIIHNAHYADNIYRPVDYFEPKYLYVRYLFSTMEVTFYANFPISYIGTRGMAELFDVDNKNGINVRRSACYKIFGFIFGSLLTVMHYRVEPPSSYQWTVNFTIAGEGLIAVILAGLILYCLKQAKTDNGIYQAVNQEDDQEELLMDEIPLQSKNSVFSARHRSPRRID